MKFSSIQERVERYTIYGLLIISSLGSLMIFFTADLPSNYTNDKFIKSRTLICLFFFFFAFLLYELKFKRLAKLLFVGIVAVVSTLLQIEPYITREVGVLVFLGPLVGMVFFGLWGLGITSAASYIFMLMRADFNGIYTVPTTLVIYLIIIGLIALVRYMAEYEWRRAEQERSNAHEKQKELISSEERLRMVIDNVKEYSIIVLDTLGNVASWNAGSERIHGYKTDEIIGKHVGIFYPEEARETKVLSKNFEIALEEGRFFEETIQVRKDGTKFLASVIISPLRDNEGNLRGFTEVVQDVTEMRRIEDQLVKSEARFRKLVESDIIGVFLADYGNGRILEANDAFLSIIGYEREDLLNGLLLNKILLKNDDISVKLHEINATVPFEQEILKKDGSPVPVLVGIVKLDEPEGSRCICIVLDLTERKRSEEKISNLAFYDQLTKLPNRILFQVFLQKAIKSAAKDGTKVAVMFIDFDRFKNINDSLGHDTGDKLLREASKRLVECVKQPNTVSRQGGDEFTVILRGIKEEKEVCDIVEKIISKFAEPFQLGDQEVFTTPSIGISIFPDDADQINILIRYADVAMYNAKKQGGNTYRFYTKDMNSEIFEKLVLENHLRKAIANNELVLNYQPKVDIRTGEVVGMEVLTRWNSKFLGQISPLKFFPLAEETGLVESIGNWILKSACRQNKRWHDLGYNSLKVGVNISALQVNSNLVANVKSALKEAKLKPEFLELEITESSTMKPGILDILRELKSLGISISIDDFGTGYSSLSRLKELPIDTLKIDQSFIRDTLTDIRNTAIVSSIITIAHNLNLNVIAEGVEHMVQIELLRELECDQVQGYLISKPLPEQEFLNFLNKKEIYQYEGVN